MDKPLVSICIPCYNGERFFHECIESAISQTYKYLEILIIDDRSTDSTLEIANDYALKNPRIRVCQNDKNIGLVNNWNKCLKKAKGQWIHFLFQDDILKSNCIEEKLKLAQKYHVNFVLGAREFQFSPSISDFSLTTIPKLSDYFSSVSLISPKETAIILSKNYLCNNFIGEPIIGLFHINLINKYGQFNTNLKQLVDFEFWLRLSTNESFAYTPKELSIFRIHTLSTSNKNNQTNASIIDYILISLEIENNHYYKKLRSFFQGISFDFNKKHTINFQRNLRAGNNQLTNELKEIKHIEIPPYTMKTKLFLFLPFQLRKLYFKQKRTFLEQIKYIIFS